MATPTTGAVRGGGAGGERGRLDGRRIELGGGDQEVARAVGEMAAESSSAAATRRRGDEPRLITCPRCHSHKVVKCRSK